MSEVKKKQDEKAKLDRVKEIIKKNWKPFTIGVTLTTVTFIVTRRFTNPNAMLAKTIFMKDSVLIFSTYARRQGPPSWVVRCVENQRVFVSQDAAARAMKLSKAHLSEHLNLKRHNVGGYHFERVAISTPNTG